MIFCPVCGRKYATVDQHKTAEMIELASAQEKPLDKSMGEILHFPHAPEKAEPDQGTVTAVEDPPQPCREIKRPRKKWGLPAAAVVAAVLAILGIIAAFLAPSKGGVPRAVLRGRGSVVRVVAEYADGVSFGSGFVTTSNGRETYIATNAHVVEGVPYTISVWFDGGEAAARVQAIDTSRDLCVLRCEWPIDARALRLSGTGVEQGAAVYTMGFPAAADSLSDTLAYGSEEATITNGIVSAVRSATLIEGGRAVELLQINAAVNSGNSGGPLFDEKGRVIGINTYNVEDSQGIFGAVSVKELTALMAEQGIPTGGILVSWPIVAGIAAIAVALLAVVVLLRKRQAKMEWPEEVERVVPTPEPVQEEPKKEKRKRPLLRVCVALVALCIIVGGTFGGLYMAAAGHADKWEFSAAGKLLSGREFVAAFDPELVAYIDAGLLLERGQYEEAQTAFTQLSEKGYRDSADLVYECDYRYAFQLADMGEWETAIEKMSQVAEYNYKDAAAQVDNIYYQKANYVLFEENDLYEGFKQMEKLADKGYLPAKEATEILQETMYCAGQVAYREENYEKAAKLFSCVRLYKDTENYIALINAKRYLKLFASKGNFSNYMRTRKADELFFEKYIGSCYNDSKIAIEDIKEIIDFEDAAFVLLRIMDL